MAQPTASESGSGSTGLGSGLAGFAGTSDAEDPSDDRNVPPGGDSLGTPLSLSSDQIIRILQQNPDLVVELKSQVADRLQQQGTEIDANNITDQMLYDQIATNADLRTNITTFLRARGYISLQRSPKGGRECKRTEQWTAIHFRATLAFDFRGSDAAGLAAASGLVSGTSRSGSNGWFPTNSIPSMNSVGNTADSEQRRGREAANASTDMPKVLRQPTPYNLQSMRDLYTQIPEQSATLKRFGSEVFVNRSMSAMARGGAGRDTPLDVPLGPGLCYRARGHALDQHVGWDDPEHQHASSIGMAAFCCLTPAPLMSRGSLSRGRRV